MDAHEAPDIDREAGARLLRRNIEQLEADGLRAMREAVLKLLPDGAERNRLKAIDDAIQAHRERLRSLGQ